ncbi:hypothetical protein FXO38_31371 [Capsicum annuum]|nr:hypothetical protein FXO38_31371 [Capsicum annuum]
MCKEENPLGSGELYWLDRGLLDGVQRFKGYEVNDFRFHTKLLEEKRKTQNSGVLVIGVVNGAISENTFHQYACNDYLYAFEEDEDFINWRRNDLEVISTDVTLADDIIEDIESEPEINDEDLLL